MIWQDIILMLGGFGFVIALVPAVRNREKPPVSTSLMTGSILVIFVICYAALDLWLAFVATITTAVMWLCLATQVLLRKL